jgi:hypothetical protein
MAGSDEHVNPTRLFHLTQRVAPVGRGIISTLLKVDAWASSIQSDTPAFVPSPLPESTASEVIEQFALALVDDAAAGIERLLLLKSLQEALLSCVDQDTDLTAGEIIAQLAGFVVHHGKSVFLQLFLSLYFFNDVLLDGSPSSWIRTTLSLEEFQRTIEDVERMCRRAVSAAYADVRDRSTAETLIHNIEAELRRGIMRLAG